MDEVSAPSTHPYIPHIPPFQPRQRHRTTPIPAFNRRAAIFHGIRSRLPPLTSRAACARYRISIKTAASASLPIAAPHIATPHTADLLTAAAQCILIQLHDAHEHLTTLTPVIQNSFCASSSRCIHGPPHHSHIIPRVLSSISTPLHRTLKPAPSPYAPLSIFGGFFGG
ncbi:hypothetical protein DFH08DRAFT_866182 [Mycena albidolilacea]|uniref:Uncharacterized protein n=1 Tax=Mycena albidolilacea TaxID=1033008 RepID=A0AAD7A346_9AGAR|nr:hypothetical protein DFH08DRAFT_866182 [Mycena albidolilacea]